MNAHSMYHQPGLNFKELVALHFFKFCQIIIVSINIFPRGHGPFHKHQESEHLSKL